MNRNYSRLRIAAGLRRRGWFHTASNTTFPDATFVFSIYLHDMRSRPCFFGFSVFGLQTIMASQTQRTWKLPRPPDTAEEKQSKHYGGVRQVGTRYCLTILQDIASAWVLSVWCSNTKETRHIQMHWKRKPLGLKKLLGPVFGRMVFFFRWFLCLSRRICPRILSPDSFSSC